jgi:hypothetical protein
MPGMVPKFMNPLHFQADHSLEVCGPTNEQGAQVASLNVTRLVIADHQGNLIDHTYDPPIQSQPGPDAEWETDFEDADETLVDGPAIGLAIGFLRMDDGTEQPISWAQAIRLTHRPEVASGGNSQQADVVAAR